MNKPLVADRQAAFNIAWDAFVVQKKPPSVLPGSPGGVQSGIVCCYYNKSGGAANRCAIGLLLKEETAQGLANVRSTIGSILYKAQNALQKKASDEVSHLGEEFLVWLQMAHDDAAFATMGISSVAGGGFERRNFHDEVRDSLLCLAQAFKLEIPK